jgi:hypothetical protein
MRMDIGDRIKEAVRSLRSRGEIVQLPDKDGGAGLYHRTIGESLETGEVFPILTPLALTDEFSALGKYIALRQRRYEQMQGAESSLRL